MGSLRAPLPEDQLRQILELLQAQQGNANVSQSSIMDSLAALKAKALKQADGKSFHSADSEGSTKAGTESASDSDGSGSRKSTKVQSNVVPPPGLLVADPTAVSFEPMKIPLPSYATLQEPQQCPAQIGPQQKLRDGLEQSLQKLVQQLQQQQQEQNAAAALQQLTSAVLQQDICQRSMASLMQMQGNAGLMPPSYTAEHDLHNAPHTAAQPHQALKASAAPYIPAAGPMMPFAPQQAQQGPHRQKAYPNAPGATTIDLAKSLRADGGGSGGKGAGRDKGNKGATHHKGGGKGGDRTKTVDKDTNVGSGAKQDVRDADRSRTLVCLKVNRLGFEAEKDLLAHYSQFGKVDYVFVPLKVKRVHATAMTPSHSHLRPSGLGFVVMDKEEVAQAIIASGSEQVVNGKVISVRAFKQGVNNEDKNDKDHE